MKKFMFLLLTIMLLGLVSASGLKVINQSAINIDKIYGIPANLTFDLTNDASYTFYNITLDNENVQMANIPSLAPGQIIKVNATISNELNFNSLIKVKGYHITNIGASNTTHNVEINFYDGLSQCSFTATKGDSVSWHNSVNDEIRLKNTETNLDITTILFNGSYSTHFENPTSLSYLVSRRGYVFAGPCTITVIDDNGPVNDPDYDGNFTLAVNVVYNPTNITYNLPVKNYTINVFETQDGVMSITNNGNSLARNITLKAEWVSFNSNSFDLYPGQTKALTYTVQPIITNTNDTDKNYTKNLVITGNFPTINDSFSIYIPYMSLGNGSVPSNYQNFGDYIRTWCFAHPSESWCRNESQVVYVYTNNGTDQFNVTFERQQVKEIFGMMFDVKDQMDLQNNYNKERFYNIELNTNTTSLKVDAIAQRVEALATNTENNSSFWSSIFFIGLFVVLILVTLTVILVIRKLKRAKETVQWGTK